MVFKLMLLGFAIGFLAKEIYEFLNVLVSLYKDKTHSK